jgi:putative ABC transport system permease protein
MSAMGASMMQDLRYSLRQLRRSPGFAAIVVLTLSLGIGAAAAVFSVIDAVLLRPLPFAHQERLVFPDTTAQAGYTQPWSYLSYLDARAQLKTFDALAGYTEFLKINLEGPSGPVSLNSVRGTDNFFNIFGVKPILGRTYLPGEDQPGRDNVAVLSYEVWQTQFGGQANAVGKVVRLDGAPYTVIGVMPAGFRFPLSARNAIYKPLNPDPQWKANRGSHWMRVVGLLKAGVSREQAQSDFARVLADLGRAYPDTDGGRTVSVVPLHAQVSGKTSGPLKTLILAVLALLAIACVNVAGLLLARGVKREREIALRAAVGAGRMRLVRQMVTESLVLSVAGLAGGMVVSWLLLAAMQTFLVDALARGTDVHMNWTVLVVALAFSAVTSVVASLAPAVRLSGTDPNRALRAGGGAGTGTGQHRLRSLFVVTQVALSLVLLMVSGLLLRNLQGMLKTNLGFDAKTILTTAIDLSPGNYEGRDPLVTFYRPLVERVAHLPGVQGAGLINILPVQNWGSNGDVHISGQPPYPPNQEMLAEERLVSAGYFDAMGIKLVHGRMLSQALDTPDRPASAVVVNEAFRRKFFSAGGDPVGAHMDNHDKAELKTGIVGVVSDVRQDLNEPPLAEMDWLIDEIAPKERLGNLANMTLVVRSDGDLQALAPSLRNAMHEIDPTVPFKTPETMTEVVSETLVFERMESWLFGIFAAFALLLAVVGLYGLVNHEVELRTREIGIRMALGSTRGLVLRRVALLMLVGAGTGWVLTLALKKVLAAVVEMHASHDAVLLAGVTAGLIAVGVLVSVAPARRAATIDPMQALRDE